jgi:hypothetical protein
MLNKNGNLHRQIPRYGGAMWIISRDFYQFPVTPSLYFPSAGQDQQFGFQISFLAFQALCNSL